jgi:hypothetical protein
LEGYKLKVVHCATVFVAATVFVVATVFVAATFLRGPQSALPKLELLPHRHYVVASISTVHSALLTGMTCDVINEEGGECLLARTLISVRRSTKQSLLM